jgi:hypothetical protein
MRRLLAILVVGLILPAAADAATSP